VVDHITEIPLPGRTVVASTGDSTDRATGITLPSFVAGPENRLVAAAVTELTRDDDPQKPLIIRRNVPILALYGPSGSGKTHVASGLVRLWHNRCGSESAVYFTAADFRRALADAIDSETVPAFRNRIRSCRLLAIDDLHRLPNDGYLSEELRNTLDAFESAGGTVVVTSPHSAGMLVNLTPDIRSRLASGLVLQLALPGTAARERLIHQLAAALGRTISDDAADRLAAGVQGSANELVGTVFELLTAVPSRIGIDLKHADNLLARRATRRPTLREITALVAKYFRQPQAVLRSASRRQSAVLPRAIVVYLARELTGASYDEIGRSLGGRDHTTVMHNYRKIERDRQHDLAIQETLTELRRILLSC
jgi:chromosomal replication initiator protein